MRKRNLTKEFRKKHKFDPYCKPYYPLQWKEKQFERLKQELGK